MHNQQHKIVIVLLEEIGSKSGQASLLHYYVIICYDLSMVRKPRLHLPGGVYHVMMRGNGGQDIFFSDDDRYHFFLLLQEGITRFDYRIHGFCCMGNHIHLALQVSDESLSKIMQNLSFRYTRWVNKQQRRTGHLFQGRYKAILVDAQSYLLELVRYIHLNPVRAGLVKDPGDYLWSGHRAYLGEETIPWLTTDWILAQFSQQTTRGRQSYRRFIQSGIGDGYREEFHYGAEDARILGDDSFLERAFRQAAIDAFKPPSLNQLIRVVCDDYGFKTSDLSLGTRQRGPAEARAVIGLLAVELGAGSLTEVGRRFGRDVVTLSEGVKRIRSKLAVEKLLVARIESIRNSLI